MGSWVQRKSKGQREPGIGGQREPEASQREQEARECQGLSESARESERVLERARCQIPPKNFPQVFKRGFFLRFL